MASIFDFLTNARGGGLFPELGGGPGGYERLPPELEAQLAQEARDAAAKKFAANNGRPVGTADMSLWDNAPQTLTQQLMPSMPYSAPQQGTQIPPAMAPMLPQPLNVPQLKVAGSSEPYPTDVSSRARDVGQPLSLAPQQPQPQPMMQQPNQQAMPQYAQGPGVGDRLGAGVQGFFGAGSPMEAIGNLIGGISTGKNPNARTIDLGTDPLTGQKQYGVYDPINQRITPISVQGAGGSKQYDSNLRGEDYLKQYPPEVQAAVKDYIAGKQMPTGNPRLGAPAQIKLIAQKYGQDIGTPVDDTTFAARRTMRNDLQKTTPGSIGGQITFARTSINHLDQVAKAAEALNNQDWGLTPISNVVNNLRGLTTEQASKIAALQDAAQHYGQEVTKFYAGSPGGEAERQRFLTALNGAKTPKELAAVIEQERNLIPERLTEIENRIKGTLGDTGDFPVHSKESTAALENIGNIVARMRGIAPANSSAPTGKVRRYNPSTGMIE